MGTCWCGKKLIEVNYGGGNAQGKGANVTPQCPDHGFDYEKKPD
ncbi:hypothetical protein SRABI98_00974 [Microbacterium sp. Bi98]|nr:hypothetical protein SRABI98_00974 [Microbacterium sp. Bi98]